MLVILKRILGVICLILGLLALVTPLTPGAWLILVGLELLGLSMLLPRPIREFGQRLQEKLGLKKKP